MFKVANAKGLASKGLRAMLTNKGRIGFAMVDANVIGEIYHTV